MSIFNKIKSFITGKEKTMFDQQEEGEMTNIVVSFLVVVSLLLFPVPVWGLSAIVAWLVFLIVAISRKYSNRGIIVIAVVFVSITTYQLIATPAFLEEQRLTTELLEVTPEKNLEVQKEHNVQVEIINENVKSIEYQWSVSRGYEPNGFEPMELTYGESTTLTLKDLSRGGYYLVFRVELHDGNTRPIVFYGRYALDYPNQ